MDNLSRTEACRLTRRDPDSIRRAVASGALTETVDENGVKGVTYESLTRYAAERHVSGFHLSAGILTDDAADDAAAPFWGAISLLVARVELLREMHANARQLEHAGRRDDARVQHDWAALAEFAEIIISPKAGAPWRVRLPALGLEFPVPGSAVRSQTTEHAA